MTRWLAIALGSAGLTATTSLSQEQCASPPPVLAYANGVLNSYHDAADSLTALYSRILAEAKGYTSLRKWSLFPRATIAYNFSEGLFRDLYQALDQKVDDIDSEYLIWVNDLAEAPEKVQNEAARILNDIDSDFVEANYDATIQAHTYLELINSGLAAVVVAHSQGNLYSNSVLQNVVNRMAPGGDGNVLQLLSVATPASYVFQNGPYITLTSDHMIRAIPTSLPANTTNSNSGYFDHAFVKFYLKGDVSGKKLISHLDSLFGQASSSTNLLTTDSAESPSYVNVDLVHMWYFEQQIIRGYDRQLTNEECLALMAFEKVYAWWGETCEYRGQTAIKNWIDRCYKDEWSDPGQYRFDCALFDLPENFTPGTGQIVGTLHPECKVTMDNRMSKITAATVAGAKSIIAASNELPF